MNLNRYNNNNNNNASCIKRAIQRKKKGGRNRNIRLCVIRKGTAALAAADIPPSLSYEEKRRAKIILKNGNKKY